MNIECVAKVHIDSLNHYELLIYIFIFPNRVRESEENPFLNEIPPWCNG